MRPIQPLTPVGRDRALNRLRRLSVGAGIGSLVAVGGLSVVAAASYSGRASTAAVAVSTSSSTALSASATANQAAATAAPTSAPTAAPVVTSGGS